jgi:hypothetical protein
MKWIWSVFVELPATLAGLKLLVVCVPAVGGMVIVGKMVHEYGSCSCVRSKLGTRLPWKNYRFFVLLFHVDMHDDKAGKLPMKLKEIPTT